MNMRVRGAGCEMFRRVAPSVMQSAEEVPRLRAEMAHLRKQLRRLRRRVAELEDEVQEARRLNRRIAELTDVVQELLLPIAQQDESRVSEILKRYRAGM